MKAGADIIGPAESAAIQEAFNDEIPGGQFFNAVPDIGMGFQGQDLAVDPEGADALAPAENQGLFKADGVGQADLPQPFQLLCPGKFLQVSGSGPSEFDLLLLENTA